MPRVSLECAVCGSSFEVRISEVGTRRQQTTCSPACRYKRSSFLLRNRVAVPCAYCKKVMEIVPSHVKPLQTCSRECLFKWRAENQLPYKCPVCGAGMRKKRPKACSQKCSRDLWRSKRPPKQIPAIRACNKCKQELPFTKQFFPPSKTHSGGLYPLCRLCNCKKRQDWAEKNRVALNARRRENRAEGVNLKARKRGARGYISNEIIDELFLTQNGQCAYCDCDISSGYQVDHIYPIVRGGSNEATNLCLACRSCNQSKSASTVEEWRERCPVAV